LENCGQGWIARENRAMLRKQGTSISY